MIEAHIWKVLIRNGIYLMSQTKKKLWWYNKNSFPVKWRLKVVHRFG